MAAMDETAIRPPRPAEARMIARLDVETWRTTYAGVLSARYLVGLSEPRREIGWRMAILREPRDIRVAVDGGGVVRGFGSCGPSRGERDFPGEVFTLYVAPDWQNRGVGRQLLIALFRRLVSSGLDAGIVWVLRNNPSRFFYERLGGRLVSHKPIPVGGVEVEALAYGWPDLPAYLAAVSSEDGGAEG
jgi:GNAT superfamily N-acetyltransferase